MPLDDQSDKIISDSQTVDFLKRRLDELTGAGGPQPSPPPDAGNAGYPGRQIHSEFHPPSDRGMIRQDQRYGGESFEAYKQRLMERLRETKMGEVYEEPPREFHPPSRSKKPPSRRGYF